MNAAGRRTGETLTGRVATFDEQAGYGTVTGEGLGSDGDAGEWFFHCTAIADGSRTIDVGAAVHFRLAPGHLGRLEGRELRPV